MQKNTERCSGGNKRKPKSEPKIGARSQWDDSTGRGICHPAWWPEFDSQDSCGGENRLLKVVLCPPHVHIHRINKAWRQIITVVMKMEHTWHGGHSLSTSRGSSANSPTTQERSLSLCPFCRQRNWDLARLPRLSKILRLVVVGARLEPTALMALLSTPPRPRWSRWETDGDVAGGATLGSPHYHLEKRKRWAASQRPWEETCVVLSARRLTLIQALFLPAP